MTETVIRSAVPLRYTVTYELVIEVDAHDAVEAIEKANELAEIKDAAVYVEGNLIP